MGEGHISEESHFVDTYEYKDRNALTSWVDFSNIAGDRQHLYIRWMQLSDGRFVVYRNYYYTYDYEGQTDDKDEMLIQDIAPTAQECKDLLIAWINQRVDEWKKLP